jgi:transcriptional regulator with XRE-family HTH domain
MDFWERLRVEIKNNNTTQEWIASKTGIPFGTLRKWFSRKTMPNADQAVRIAQALGTTVEELVTGEDRSLPSQRLRPLFRDIAVLPEQDISEIEALVAAKKSRYQQRKADTPKAD